MGTGVFFLESKRPKNEANHSPLFNSQINNECSCTVIYLICFLCVGRDSRFLENFVQPKSLIE